MAQLQKQYYYSALLPSFGRAGSIHTTYDRMPHTHPLNSCDMELSALETLLVNFQLDSDRATRLPRMPDELLLQILEYLAVGVLETHTIHRDGWSSCIFYKYRRNTTVSKDVLHDGGRTLPALLPLCRASILGPRAA